MESSLLESCRSKSNVRRDSGETVQLKREEHFKETVIRATERIIDYGELLIKHGSEDGAKGSFWKFFPKDILAVNGNGDYEGLSGRDIVRTALGFAGLYFEAEGFKCPTHPFLSQMPNSNPNRFFLEIDWSTGNSIQ